MKYYLIFIVSLILFSCQEEITLDLPQAEMKLVVEGAIEPGFPPYVILTQNQGYFDEIDIDTYSDLFVNNVDTVKVWYYKDSGEKEIKFLSKIEGVDTLPTIFTDLSYDFSGDFPYYFSQEEKTYFLEIEAKTEETEIMFDYYESKGWKVGKAPMKCWKSAARNWKRRSEKEESEFPDYYDKEFEKKIGNDNNKVSRYHQHLRKIGWKSSYSPTAGTTWLKK